MQQAATVVGTGRMGSALAIALFNQGVATTVWNRTLSKTEPLARLGLRAAASLEEAVRESGVVILMTLMPPRSCAKLRAQVGHN